MLFKTPLQALTAFAAFILPLLIVGTMDRHDPILQAPERKPEKALAESISCTKHGTTCWKTTEIHVYCAQTNCKKLVMHHE